MIPALDPDPKSDFQSLWGFRIRIRIQKRSNCDTSSDMTCTPDARPPEDVAAPVAAVVPQAAEGQLGDGRGLLRDRARGEAVILLNK